MAPAHRVMCLCDKGIVMLTDRDCDGWQVRYCAETAIRNRQKRG
jgi:hypothetical protein